MSWVTCASWYPKAAVSVPEYYRTREHYLNYIGLSSLKTNWLFVAANTCFQSCEVTPGELTVIAHVKSTCPKYLIASLSYVVE